MKVESLRFEEFIELLKQLDQRIEQNIVIKAIGGFSLMCNAKILNISPLDMRFLSRDIDSYTPDFPISIEKNIISIGKENNLEDYLWLNNNWASLTMFEDELAKTAIWIEYPSEKFEHIKLFYLNLESLLKFKIRSLDNTLELERKMRLQDPKDIESIIRYFGEDINQLSLPFKEKFENYPLAFEYMVEFIKN
jgi:hypothetical protein